MEGRGMRVAGGERERQGNGGQRNGIIGQTSSRSEADMENGLPKKSASVVSCCFPKRLQRHQNRAGFPKMKRRGFIKRSSFAVASVSAMLFAGLQSALAYNENHQDCPGNSKTKVCEMAGRDGSMHSVFKCESGGVVSGYCNTNNQSSVNAWIHCHHHAPNYQC